LNVCQLPWVKSTHHQELIFVTFHFRIIGSTRSCQGVHQDWLAWCIQLDVYLKRWQMEDCIPYMLWPFWVCCDALWLYECTCCLLTFHEQYFSCILGWFCGLLH
jgi:hypothetical protein